MAFRTRGLSVALAALAALNCFSAGASGQVDEKRRSELGERQRLVERNMAELESRFVRVAESLQVKEPERAKRLIDTLQHAKERLIAKRMADVTALLDGGKLAQAEQELRLVVEDLDKLVRLLLNDERDEMTKSQEIEALERWKQQVQELRREQNQQTRETNKVAHKESALNDLDAKIKQVEQLIQDQKELLDQTAQEANAGIRALDRIADRQFDVRQRTEALSRELGGNNSTSESQPDASASHELLPNEAGDKDPKQPKPDRPDPNQPSQRPDGPPPPQQGQPGNDSAESNPAGENSSASGDKQPAGDKQPGADSNASGQKRQPGQKPLENSMRHQKSAEENLTQGQPADAQRSQQKSLDEMQAALDELNKERRRIASLPKEALAEMAKQQRRTRGKTLELAKEMAQAKRPSKEGQSNDPNQKQPGQQPVQEAEQAMDQAAGGLEEQDPQRAERQQDKADKKLDEALREIEERLAQLREETRQEKLARLEARFSEMLMRQRVATNATIELDDKRTSLSQLPRREQLNLIRTTSEENEIGELGQQAYELLIEDGSSAVFPECVVDLREDLGRVSKLLETERTDQLTQLVQRDVEAALEDLLEALKQAKKDGGGGGGGGGGKQPLLRKSSELKMLRAAQLRVNRRTKQFEAIRSEEILDPALVNEIANIGQRQAEISTMTEQLLEKEE